MPGTLPVDRVMCPDSLGRTLLAMAVPPAHRRDATRDRVPVLGRRGELPEDLRRLVLASDAHDEAVPVEQAGAVDAEAVAAWITGHHPAESYPAVVLGATHGAAVHLAAACGAAWLPASFAVTVPWPGGSPGDWPGAKAFGSEVAARILAGNPGVTVRQVHDPVQRGSLCGVTVTLHIRWRTLPRAYREFLRSRLAPGGASVLVRDLRTWPVHPVSPGYSFQVGSPTSGWRAGGYDRADHSFQRLLRGLDAGDWPEPGPEPVIRYAETSGEPGLGPEVHQIAKETARASHRVFFTDTQALSAGVADLHRAWLQPVTGARHCVVSVGRMVDPWQAIAGGMVPYWCESSTRQVVEDAQFWLAGSPPFQTVGVLPEPPGVRNDATASLTNWRAVAAFAEQNRRVDRLLAGRYPVLPAAASTATRFLATTVGAVVPPAPMSAAEAVGRLKGGGTVRGLLVT